MSKVQIDTSTETVGRLISAGKQDRWDKETSHLGANRTIACRHSH
jgi:hypothetical protein